MEKFLGRKKKKTLAQVALFNQFLGLAIVPENPIFG